jgi:hypothetical protein
MSNFTTFFPSAGGGGGEGSGINSYAPFSVDSDNNPQGYIQSTGVYTNPVDSSVWLKTGKYLSSSFSSSYPNATNGIFPDTTNNPVEFPRVVGFAANAAHAYEVEQNNNNVYKRSLSNGSSLVGRSFGSVSSSRVVLTSTRVYVLALLSGSPNYWAIEAFDLDLTNIPSERIATSLVTSMNSLIKVGTSWFGVTAARTIKEFDSTFANVLNTYTLSDINGDTSANISTIAYDGTSFWVASMQNGVSGYAFKYNTSFVPDGSSFYMTTLQSQANVNANWVGYNEVNSKLYSLGRDVSSPYEAYYQEFDTVIGDSAKTDSSGSGQPLFIKIK